jgi:hypothetical protein
MSKSAGQVAGKGDGGRMEDRRQKTDDGRLKTPDYRQKGVRAKIGPKMRT